MRRGVFCCIIVEESCWVLKIGFFLVIFVNFCKKEREFLVVFLWNYVVVMREGGRLMVCFFKCCEWFLGFIFVI